MFSSRMTLFTGQLQKFHRVLALYRREVLQEFLQRATSGNIVEESLRGNTGPDKNKRPSEDLGVRMNGTVVEDGHSYPLARLVT